MFSFQFSTIIDIRSFGKGIWSWHLGFVSPVDSCWDKTQKKVFPSHQIVPAAFRPEKYHLK